MQKLSLHAMASNSQRGLPQRLSQKCLALSIPTIKQASATHQIRLSKLGKIKKHQNNSKTTQVNSELLKVQTATGQLTEQASTFRPGRAESRHNCAFRSKLNRWVKLKSLDLEKNSQRTRAIMQAGSTSPDWPQLEIEREKPTNSSSFSRSGNLCTACWPFRS